MSKQEISEKRQHISIKSISIYANLNFLLLYQRLTNIIAYYWIKVKATHYAWKKNI